MTESELIEQADAILAAINQPSLTPTEQRSLWCKPHSNAVEFFNSLSFILNKRDGAGDAVERLNYYAKFNGVDVNLIKTVPNNVFLGSPL